MSHTDPVHRQKPRAAQLLDRVIADKMMNYVSLPLPQHGNHPKRRHRLCTASMKPAVEQIQRACGAPEWRMDMNRRCHDRALAHSAAASRVRPLRPSASPSTMHLAIAASPQFGEIKAKDFKGALAELHADAENHQHADVYKMIGFSLRQASDLKQLHILPAGAGLRSAQHKGAARRSRSASMRKPGPDRQGQGAPAGEKAVPGKPSLPWRRQLTAAPNEARGSLPHRFERSDPDQAHPVRAFSCMRPGASSRAMTAAVRYMEAFGIPGELLPPAIAIEAVCGLAICSDTTPARRP